ncbi:MAG: LytTR family transcriptional regulator [Calditrichaeota bacterium]|nr:LytTR family transcriptional regulator [Calditrichota bacterium]
MRRLLSTVIAWLIILTLSLITQLCMTDVSLLNDSLKNLFSLFCFGFVVILLIDAVSRLNALKFVSVQWLMLHLLIAIVSYFVFELLFTEKIILDESKDMVFISKSAGIGLMPFTNFLADGFFAYSFLLGIYCLFFMWEKERYQRTDKISHLEIKTGRKKFYIEIESITHIKSSDNYSTITTDRTNYLIRESISSLENRLCGNEFIRIHRSVIIRIDQFKELLQIGNGNYELKLHDGSTFRIGNKYKHNVFEQFRSHFQVL